MIQADLCLAGLDATSDEAAIRALAGALARARKVKATFEAAAVVRERRSPTGLPFPGGAVAVPHADPEHVEAAAIAIASLARPVTFRQMGTPSTRLDVSLVVMPALTAPEQAATVLAKVLDLLRDAAVWNDLRSARDADALFQAFTRGWQKG